MQSGFPAANRSGAHPAQLTGTAAPPIAGREHAANGNFTRQAAG